MGRDSSRPSEGRAGGGVAEQESAPQEPITSGFG
jgi:hypothetical protein